MRVDVSTDRPSLNQQYPALRLIECPQIAISPASVVVAVVASLMIASLGLVVDYIVPAKKSHNVVVPPTRANSSLGSTFHSPSLRPWTDIAIPFGKFLSVNLGDYPNSLIPATSLMYLNTKSLERDPKSTDDVDSQPSESTTSDTSIKRSDRWNVLCHFLVALANWSIFGTILCRRSALLFVGNDEVSVTQVFHYSLKRWRFSAGAPLIPVAAVGLLGCALFGFGIVGRLPGIGWMWLIATSPIVAVVGFVAAFLLITTAVGWPLMIASIATDDCDSFGGLSRAYSGITSRVWYVACLSLAGLVLGQVLMLAVTLLGELTTFFVLAGVSFGAGEVPTREALTGALKFITDETINGVGISYFWSVTTVIYLLLRYEIDRVPLERLAVDESDRAVREPFPIVGMLATDATDEGKTSIMEHHRIPRRTQTRTLDRRFPFLRENKQKLCQVKKPKD